MRYEDMLHSELVDECVRRGLIARPLPIAKGRGWARMDKLWRRRELIAMLEASQ